jgi:hypothetical protein
MSRVGSPRAAARVSLRTRLVFPLSFQSSHGLFVPLVGDGLAVYRLIRQ